MKPYEMHLVRADKGLGYSESARIESYNWVADNFLEMRNTIRELLQHCNNADVAEKAWQLLDIIEVGE